MKKIVLFIFLISTISFAQFKIEGTMVPTIKTDWVILYKVEGTKQKFIKNTTIKIDSVAIEGKKQAIGTFSFTIPNTAKVGAYRISYRLKGGGFVDFFYNKEDVSFGFHPDYPTQSVTFSKSKENITYRTFTEEYTNTRHKLDSIQVAALNNVNTNYQKAYSNTYKKLKNLYKYYIKKAENMYVLPFIEASYRAPSEELLKSPKDFISSMKNTFFDSTDFANKSLLNSSFLVDRITDYVFYVNYSEDLDTQKKLYKESIELLIPKLKDNVFKKDVLEFLINRFENEKNIDLVDFILETQYSKLPKEIQNKSFKEEKIKLLAAEVGRVAPDFSWKEGKKTLKLSTLKDNKNYVLVFWSTGCSHCVREVPKLHEFLQEKDSIGVVAFALEKDNLGWKNFKPNLPGWYHVLGLNKWENKIARTYNIYSTPSYFILDKNKKIIAKPEELKDVKAFLEKL